MNAILNGEIVKNTEMRIPFSDRSFRYGDGLFETMYVVDGKVRLLEYHLERMREGAEILGFNLPSDLNTQKIEKWVEEIIPDSEITCKVRLMTWRKGSGIYTPDSSEINLLLTAEKAKTPPQPRKKVVFARNIHNCFSPLSRFKTNSSLHYVMAGKEMIAKQADDILLTDIHGNVSEALYSNVFWTSAGHYYSPSSETGCVEGVMRRYVLEILNKHDFPIRTGLYEKEALLKADHVFLTNSAGIIPVQRVEECNFQPPRLPTPLLPLLCADVDRSPPV